MNQVKAEIITIGDEILYGHILDTNSQWMCQLLGEIGVRVIHRVTISDNEPDIMKALADSKERSDIILITGGLGPTPDDLTKPCLAKFFDSEMETNLEALKDVTEFFTSRGREITEINKRQALLPVKCEMLSNKMGTAPGMLFHNEGQIFISMPGVPMEMKYLMDHQVVPRIRKLYHLPVIYHRIAKTIGIGESYLSEKIADWENALPENISLAYLPSLGIVKLRLTAVGDDIELLKTQVNKQFDLLQPVAGKYMFGYDDDTIEKVVGEILRRQNRTLAAAESCTGGYFSHKITSVPGSSEYFFGGIVSYDNTAKIDQLGVPVEVLDKVGAVSEEVVKLMAENVRKKFNTDIGIAISGIAGPDGGTEEKPVGTVWISYSDEKNTISKKLSLGFRSRMINIELSSLAVMNLLRIQLNSGD